MANSSSIIEKRDRASKPTRTFSVRGHIEADMRQRIHNGDWKPGQMLPSRIELARSYSVAVGTVQQALAVLTADGTVRSEGGRGTFVAGNTTTARGVSEIPSATRIDNTSGCSALSLAKLGIVALVDERGISTGSLETIPMRDMANVIEREFTRLGGGSVEYQSVVGLDGEWHHPPEIIARFAREGVGAVALIDIFDAREYRQRFFDECRSANLPLVYLSGYGSYVPCPHVFVDQQHAGYVVASHLLAQGAQRLSFIAPYSEPWLDDRIGGAKIAVEGFPDGGASINVVPSGRVEDLVSRIDDWVPCVRQLFGDGVLGDGIIAPNDMFALMVASVAAELGLTAGIDFLLAGFDNLAESLAAGLTTVHPPYSEMAKEATRMLANLVQRSELNQVSSVRPVLVPRKSTRKLE